MKHIKLYSKLFESNSINDVKEIIEDYFLDVIEDPKNVLIRNEIKYKDGYYNPDTGDQSYTMFEGAVRMYQFKLLFGNLVNIDLQKFPISRFKEIKIDKIETIVHQNFRPSDGVYVSSEYIVDFFYLPDSPVKSNQHISKILSQLQKLGYEDVGYVERFEKYDLEKFIKIKDKSLNIPREYYAKTRHKGSFYVLNRYVDVVRKSISKIYDPMVMDEIDKIEKIIGESLKVEDINPYLSQYRVKHVSDVYRLTFESYVDTRADDFSEDIYPGLRLGVSLYRNDL